MLLAAYIVPSFASKETSIFIVSSVYLSSIIYSLFGVIKSLPDIYAFIFKYRGNVKVFLEEKAYAEAYPQVKRDLNNLAFYEKLFNHWWGNDNAHGLARELAERGVNLAWKEFVTISVRILALVIIYIALFRFLVAPILLDSSIHLKPWQAALYPLTYSVDFFFNTSFTQFII